MDQLEFLGEFAEVHVLWRRVPSSVLLIDCDDS
jgi:hypothetical protein